MSIIFTSMPPYFKKLNKNRHLSFGVILACLLQIRLIAITSINKTDHRGDLKMKLKSLAGAATVCLLVVVGGGYILGWRSH